MARMAWRLKLRSGMKEEYKRRHDNIWPEMLELMRKSGIRNYSIWNEGQDLFGYFEVDDLETAGQAGKGNPVIERWNEYMKDIFEPFEDTGTVDPKSMELMFLFEGEDKDD
ncbi:MAG TPA: L-rhamnose mutarotase [Clostridiaceae bacterium]|nr:L-rhamnose mutarotase [Clostridiaceae bacterium]